MKSILERCDDLLAMTTRVKLAREGQSQASELAERRGELEEAQLALTLEAMSTATLVGRGDLAAAALPDGAKVLESVERVQARLLADPKSLTAGSDYKRLLTRIEKFQSGLSGSNATAWAGVVQRHLGGNEGFLRQVEQVPGQASAVDQIRDAREQLKTVAKQLPRDDEGYARFLYLSATLQERLALLDPDDFPREVLTFFRHAQSPGGAPLDLLTNAVRDWLATRGLLDRVRVRFGGVN